MDEILRLQKLADELQMQRSGDNDRPECGERETCAKSGVQIY